MNGKYENKLKNHIHLARVYRRLKVDRVTQNIYLFLWVLPCLLLLLFSCTQISLWVTVAVEYLLKGFVPQEAIGRGYSEFLPYFGGVYFIQLPDAYPNVMFIAVNIIVATILLWICFTGERAGHPLSIYCAIGLFVHLVSCVVFFFATDYFSWSVNDYSELYMKQQIGIWILFLLVSGLITAFLGIGNIFRRILAFLVIMAYSFIFGTLRYLIFMYIVSEISMLYMAVLFFILGPFFDFLYLVFIYGLYVERIVESSHADEGMEAWQWS